MTSKAFPAVRTLVSSIAETMLAQMFSPESLDLQLRLRRCFSQPPFQRSIPRRLHLCVIQKEWIRECRMSTLLFSDSSDMVKDLTAQPEGAESGPSQRLYPHSFEAQRCNRPTAGMKEL